MLVSSISCRAAFASPVSLLTPICSDPAKKAQHHRHLLFREEADLRVEMVAPVALAAHSILSDENKDGEDDPLGGDDSGQQAKRILVPPE